MDDSHGAWLSRICLIECAILGSFLSKTLWIYLWLAFDDVWWSSNGHSMMIIILLKKSAFSVVIPVWHQRFKCQSESCKSPRIGLFRIWSFCVWVCVCFVSYVVSRLSLADGAILPVGINMGRGGKAKTSGNHNWFCLRQTQPCQIIPIFAREMKQQSFYRFLLKAVYNLLQCK